MTGNWFPDFFLRNILQAERCIFSFSKIKKSSPVIGREALAPCSASGFQAQGYSQNKACVEGQLHVTGPFLKAWMSRAPRTSEMKNSVQEKNCLHHE